MQASRIIDAVLDCGPEDRVLFLETILDQIRPGWPRSFNIDLMHEATEWAACSTRRERKAYLWACWQRLPITDQTAFLGHVEGSQHGEVGPTGNDLGHVQGRAAA